MNQSPINLIRIAAVAFFFGTIAVSFSTAQPIADGYMKGKGHGSLVLSYSWEQYDEFFFGTEKRDAPPPYGGQITTRSVSLYGIYGLSDNLDLVLNLPFITAQGAGEGADVPEQEVSGLQDLSLFLKWRPLYTETEAGNFSFLGGLGLATPLSDYAANAVLSIGNQSTRIDARLMSQYQANSGFLVDLQAGYSVRTNDVPNAIVLGGKIGYAGTHFYVDLWSETQISDSSAPDITPGVVPFNETRVNYTQVGVTGYVPLGESFGISAGVGRYVGGRNVGLATRVSGGLIYNF